MRFDSLESLSFITKILNEADAALRYPGRTIEDAEFPELLAFCLVNDANDIRYVPDPSLDKLINNHIANARPLLGVPKKAALGGVAVGAVAAGATALVLPVAGVVALGAVVVTHRNGMLLRQEKERLYSQAMQMREGIRDTMQIEARASKERRSCLQSLAILLDKALTDLGKDLGIKL